MLLLTAPMDLVCDHPFAGLGPDAAGNSVVIFIAGLHLATSRPMQPTPILAWPTSSRRHAPRGRGNHKNEHVFGVEMKVGADSDFLTTANLIENTLLITSRLFRKCRSCWL